MTRRITLIVAAVIAALILAAAVAYAGFGIGGKSQQAHPPCDELPSAAAVQDAIEQHSELTAQLEQAGPSVSVDVGRPCGGADQALVDVRYTGEQDKKKAEDVLTHADGFGVPVILTEK